MIRRKFERDNVFWAKSNFLSDVVFRVKSHEYLRACFEYNIAQTIQELAGICSNRCFLCLICWTFYNAPNV